MIACFDIEADSLLDTATKIHVISWKPLGGEVKSITGSMDEIRYGFCKMIKAEDLTLVGHNIFGYDLPLLENLLSIPFSVEPDTLNGKHVQLIDTLAWSRSYFPDMKSHGLEAWAKRVGTHKPEIEDWENLSTEEYVNRCENDTITTEEVFLYLCNKLGVEV